MQRTKMSSSSKSNSQKLLKQRIGPIRYNLYSIFLDYLLNRKLPSEDLLKESGMTTSSMFQFGLNTKSNDNDDKTISTEDQIDALRSLLSGLQEQLLSELHMHHLFKIDSKSVSISITPGSEFDPNFYTSDSHSNCKTKIDLKTQTEGQQLLLMQTSGQDEKNKIDLGQNASALNHQVHDSDEQHNDNQWQQTQSQCNTNMTMTLSSLNAEDVNDSNSKWRFQINNYKDKSIKQNTFETETNDQLKSQLTDFKSKEYHSFPFKYNEGKLISM